MRTETAHKISAVICLSHFVPNPCLPLGLGNPCYSHTERRCARTMARAGGLTRHANPWGPAPGTTGTPGGSLSPVLRSGFTIFSYNGYVCAPDSAFRKDGADVVRSYSELPIICGYFQPGQSRGVAARKCLCWLGLPGVLFPHSCFGLFFFSRCFSWTFTKGTSSGSR